MPEKTEGAWAVAQSSGKVGTGNWGAFKGDLDTVYSAAQEWKRLTSGIDKPWLCWNINDNWCTLQQKLILSVGWTPIIGWDPNCCPSKRTVLPGAIEIDFNRQFQFPAMWPHFPLEFAFMWTERLAFWHADLLVRENKLKKIVSLFEMLNDGEMAAVKSMGGLRNSLNLRSHRYWELLGCTTKGASQHQFDTGCGWWRNFYLHPNTPENEKQNRSKFYYDSGVGIMYWKKYYKRKIYNIKEKWIDEGHCTQVGNASYKNANSKGDELDLNFDLREVANRLGLSNYL